MGADTSDQSEQHPIFIEACVTQGFLIIIYLATIIRTCFNVKLNFVVLIASLMSIASTMWILEQGLILRFENEIGLAFFQN